MYLKYTSNNDNGNYLGIYRGVVLGAIVSYLASHGYRRIPDYWSVVRAHGWHVGQQHGQESVN